ncbi:AAA family ATPase [Nocardia sp. NPDC004860]|uniref:helix-turn-helix transcriptional regulator n=1 Tax=Nocardia sp. NPDC004860 TaxID=3154557 RepID=UPI0033B388FF
MFESAKSSRPVRLQAPAPDARRSSPKIAVPFLERERELDALTHAIDETSAGGGQLVVVEGPSGIGKSRLLAAAAAVAEERGAEVLTTSGGELEREYPFGLVRRLLEQRIARAAELEAKALFRGHAALVEPLLHPAAHADGPALTDEFQIIHGLYWLVVNLADEGPVVLVADDLQWGDDLSLRFLLYLAQRLDDLPITLVVAVRTSDPAADNELVTRLVLGARTTIRPSELSQIAVGELLLALAPDSIEQVGLAEKCWTSTRGNPFLLGELVTAINSGHVAVSSLTIDLAPASVARSVMLRLARMGADALALARAVAVLGTSPSHTTAAQLCGLDFAAATAACSRLTSAQIFSDRDQLAFYHPMIRTAVYDKYAPNERAEAHLRAAELLRENDGDLDEVAGHIMRGAPTRAKWARDALHAAARGAGRKGAPATAVGYLRRALEMADTDPVGDADLLFDLGIMEAAAGERTSLDHLEKALQLTDEPNARARAMYALGQTLFRYGRAEEARTVFRRGADEFTSFDRDLGLRFEAGYTASATYLIDGLREARERVAELAVAWPAGQRLSPVESLLVLHLTVFDAMSVPRSADHAERALRVLGDGVQLWRETSDGMTISHTALALTWCGFAADSAALCARVLADARNRGDSLIFAEISLARSLAMYALGHVNDAMVDAQAAITGMRRGWKSTVPAPQGILAYCLIDRGELEEASEVVREASTQLRTGATETLNIWFYMARGRLRLAQGDPEGAKEDFLKTGSLLEVRGFLNPNYVLVPWRSQAGLAAHACGLDAEARELIDKDIELAMQFGLKSTLGAALRAKALIASPRPDIELLEKSVRVLEDAGTASVELARSLLELGAAQRRAGRRVDSRDPLRRCLDLAHHAGATAVEKRAYEELLASGARPRRVVLQGADALTPSEQRIASLMVQGLVTRDIAESLYLTTSTVEWHRRNIYRKLDVGSRDELKKVFTHALSSDRQL